MNNLGENETGEGAKELDDLVGSQDMKELDVLLESFEDQVYPEIFDALMYELVTSLITCIAHVRA